MAQPHPFSIRLFLADGTPDGLRIVEKSNWTGLGLVCTRAQYSKVRNRPEFQTAGVIFFQSLRSEPWGARDFIVKDTDGNLLLFAGPGG